MTPDIARARDQAINETVAKVRGVSAAHEVTHASPDRVEAAIG